MALLTSKHEIPFSLIYFIFDKIYRTSYLNLLDVHSISGNGASISVGIIIKPSDNLNVGINYERLF